MENKKTHKVLFVCTQNVFRSLSAHHLMHKYVKDNNINGYEIDSCGTIAYDWESPYQHTLNLLKEKGVSIKNHKNKKITKEMCNESNFIICMTNDHKDFITKNFKVESYLFNEIAINKNTDLEDDNEANFSCSLNQFIDKTVNYIDKNIPNLVEGLEKMKVKVC